MFDEYAKRLEQLEQDVPKVFSKMTTRGARYFEKVAKEKTTQAGAVDTGYYRRSWLAETTKKKDYYAIKCMNIAEYASFLEDGYRIKTAHFVPFDLMQGSPKTQSLINSFKAKNPKAKGFIAKARTFKGLKIGRLSVIDTEGWLLVQLRREIEIVFAQKKTGASREEIIKAME